VKEEMGGRRQKTKRGVAKTSKNQLRQGGNRERNSPEENAHSAAGKIVADVQYQRGKGAKGKRGEGRSPPVKKD